MITLIKSLWFRRLRSIDIKILWPTIKRMAKDLDTARIGFRLHIQSDYAWQVLTDQEIDQIISGLT